MQTCRNVLLWSQPQPRRKLQVCTCQDVVRVLPMYVMTPLDLWSLQNAKASALLWSKHGKPNARGKCVEAAPNVLQTKLQVMPAKVLCVYCPCTQWHHSICDVVAACKSLCARNGNGWDKKCTWRPMCDGSPQCSGGCSILYRILCINWTAIPCLILFKLQVISVKLSCVFCPCT